MSLRAEARRAALPPLPPDIAAGLDRLARSPPLWPIGPEAWRLTIASVQAFAERWDGPARAAGWDDLSLYGLHRCAPYARLSAMGAAWVAARPWHTVVAVRDDAITLVVSVGARLRIYRQPADPEAVLPWPV